MPSLFVTSQDTAEHNTTNQEGGNVGSTACLNFSKPQEGTKILNGKALLSLKCATAHGNFGRADCWSMTPRLTG